MTDRSVTDLVLTLMIILKDRENENLETHKLMSLVGLRNHRSHYHFSWNTVFGKVKRCWEKKSPLLVSCCLSLLPRYEIMG